MRDESWERDDAVFGSGSAIRKARDRTIFPLRNTCSWRVKAGKTDLIQEVSCLECQREFTVDDSKFSRESRNRTVGDDRAAANDHPLQKTRLRGSVSIAWLRHLRVPKRVQIKDGIDRTAVRQSSILPDHAEHRLRTISLRPAELHLSIQLTVKSNQRVTCTVGSWERTVAGYAVGDPQNNLQVAGAPPRDAGSRRTDRQHR